MADDAKRIRPPGADYLAGGREATVSKKWSGDYDGGAGNSNSGGCQDVPNGGYGS